MEVYEDTSPDSRPTGIWDPQGGGAHVTGVAKGKGIQQQQRKQSVPPPGSVLTSGDNACSDPPIMEVYDDTSQWLSAT